MDVIDATDQKLGRLAAKVAAILQGKNSTAFARNKVHNVKLKIVNASKLNISEAKAKSKTYSRYSGYPGGLKKPTMEEVITKKGTSEVLKTAIYGMLPKNKLRSKIILNLTITE